MKCCTCRRGCGELRRNAPGATPRAAPVLPPSLARWRCLCCPRGHASRPPTRARRRAAPSPRSPARRRGRGGAGVMPAPAARPQLRREWGGVRQAPASSRGLWATCQLLHPAATGCGAGWGAHLDVYAVVHPFDQAERGYVLQLSPHVQHKGLRPGGVVWCVAWCGVGAGTVLRCGGPARKAAPPQRAQRPKRTQCALGWQPAGLQQPVSTLYTCYPLHQCAITHWHGRDTGWPAVFPAILGVD